MQYHCDTGRWERIEAAGYLLDNTDCPFRIEELRKCKHKGKDTAPGVDRISYFGIANMGLGAKIVFLGHIDITWVQRQRPMAW